MEKEMKELYVEGVACEHERRRRESWWMAVTLTAVL
jgi:hypothetical protein